MDGLFLDANVLFSAAYRPGAGLLQLWKLKNAVLCSSRYAVEEARVNLADEDQRTRLARLSQALHLFEAVQRKPPRGVALPEKDLPIMLAGPAMCDTSIMLPGEYLNMSADEI